MPRIDAHTPGSFCWFELATTDQTAAKQFYTALFGWDVQEFPMGPDETYTMFRKSGGEVAAAYTMRAEEQRQGVPPFWMTYVSVADADQAASRAGALGGNVVAPPFDVMEMGRMAVIADPAGAHLAVWQPKASPGTTLTGEPGTVDWVEISVPDRAKVMPFYQELFGWKLVDGIEKRPATPGDEYPHILHGDDFVGGFAGPEQRDPNAPPHLLIYFAVEDLAAATAKAASLGGRMYLPPTNIGGNGWIAVLADPQGAMFALHAGN